MKKSNVHSGLKINTEKPHWRNELLTKPNNKTVRHVYSYLNTCM